MSAVPQFSEDYRYQMPQRSLTAVRDTKVTPFAPPAQTRRERLARLKNTAPATVQTVKRLPDLRTTPSWLRWLMVAQKGSSVVMGCLVTAVLAMYAWTVYGQQAWAKEYRRLESLQHQEQQFTSSSAVLSHQIAQQAEDPATGLVPPTTANTIFLEPAPPRAPQAIAPTVDPASPLPAEQPLGY